jgi:hypothetical protein
VAQLLLAHLMRLLAATMKPVGDGVVVVGAIIEDSGSYSSAGNAYVFNLGTGVPIEMLANPNPAYGLSLVVLLQ